MLLSKKQIEAGVSRYDQIQYSIHREDGCWTAERIVQAIYQAMHEARSDRRKIVEATRGFEKLSKIQNAARRS
jgi:hypothetical protein